MATIYVNSGAAGSNNGTSWANAYTTLSGAFTGTAEASGDVFLVHYTHSETLSGNIASTLNATGAARGILIKSVDKDDSDKYRSGATIVPVSFDFHVAGTWMGMHFDNSGQAQALRLNGYNYTEFLSCKFSKQAAQILRLSTAGQRIIFTDCEFACGSSYTVGLSHLAHSVLDFRRCSFTGSKGTNADLWQLNSGAALALVARFYDCDLSGWDNLFDSGATGGNCAPDVRFVRCKLPSSFEYEDGATYLARQGSMVHLIGCAAGTLSAPVYQNDLQQHTGYAREQASKYRAASDGTTSHAFEVVAGANRTWKQTHRATQTPEFSVWVDGGAEITATVAFAHDAVGAGAAGVLNNDECWVEWSGPSDAVTPDAAPYTATSRCALNGTAAALTTDADSTWTGTSIGTKQKVSLTYTPTIGGLLTARVFFAPESGSDKTIYVCPKIDVA